MGVGTVSATIPGAITACGAGSELMVWSRCSVRAGSRGRRRAVHDAPRRDRRDDRQRRPVGDGARGPSQVVRVANRLPHGVDWRIDDGGLLGLSHGAFLEDACTL